MVAGIVGDDMGFGQPPKPGAGGVPAWGEDLLPLWLGGGSWASELDG